MSHTPTPWDYGEDNDGWYFSDERGNQLGFSFSEDDARRAVACVNACEGVSTERLENDYKQGYSVHDEIKTLRRQRDALLSVVKELEESAGYWSEYDVPLGIVDRLKQAIKECQE